tara:strand:+ start:694 stop:1131 length:438 start_codon:yes stop_codon:yes gene_type:complete
MIINIKKLELNEKYYNQIIELYSDFTSFDKNILDFKKLTTIVQNLNNNHNILLYIQDNNIIAAITLIVEQKIIHNGGKVGHIEDFVIKKEYRKKNIGFLLLNYVKLLCQKYNCYKIILDCDSLLENYYIKHDFEKKGNYMALYLK